MEEEKTPEQELKEVEEIEKEMEKPVKEEVEEMEEKAEEKEEEKEEEKVEEEIEELEKEVEAKEEPAKEEPEEEKAEEPEKEVEEPEEEEPEEEIKKEIDEEMKEEAEELAEEKPKPKPKKKKEKKEEKKEEVKEESKGSHIYGLRTTANREDQVMDFVSSNAVKKKLEVYSLIRPHGMRGYIFVEAKNRTDAEQAAFNVPYARGVLPKEIQYSEIEHMLEQVKREVNMQKNDICEIISGPFKREKAKITRIDKQKEEVVVELLEAAVPIPITVKMDAVKVIRRETKEEEE